LDSDQTLESLKKLEKEDKLEEVSDLSGQIKNGVMSEIKRVVTEVATRLESKERLEKITEEFDKLLKLQTVPDYELIIESMFQKVIGVDSKTARVFKAIHQNIIFVAAFELKSKIKALQLTRDVRTKEGWKIQVLFHNNIVSISHRRREQSLAFAPSDEQYWFEWELRMNFDDSLLALQSCNLKITNLGFDNNINPKKKDEINKVLSYGNLIIS